MKSLRDLESVGWIFWGVAFAILAAPCYFLAKAMTYDFSNASRIGLGLVMAMLGAGVIAWAVNEVVYRIQKKKYDQRRKIERKRKRKQKK